jgi:DNA-directed RNA polymerase subunit RPC12/RpoP
MDYQNRPQRQLFDVTDLGIKCAECGVDIKELPFQPTKKDDDTYGRIYCQECNRKRRRSFGGPRGGFGGGQRDRY